MSCRRIFVDGPQTFGQGAVERLATHDADHARERDLKRCVRDPRARQAGPFLGLGGRHACSPEGHPAMLFDIHTSHQLPSS